MDEVSNLVHSAKQQFETVNPTLSVDSTGTIVQGWSDGLSQYNGVQLPPGNPPFPDGGDSRATGFTLDDGAQIGTHLNKAGNECESDSGISPYVLAPCFDTPRGMLT